MMGESLSLSVLINRSVHLEVSQSSKVTIGSSLREGDCTVVVGGEGGAVVCQGPWVSRGCAVFPLVTAAHTAGLTACVCVFLTKLLQQT